MSMVTPVQLYPYLAAAQSATRAAKRARTAYETYGPGAKKAASTIYAAYKRYKRAKGRSYRARVSDIGNNVDADNAKRAVGSTVGSSNSRTLNSLNLVALEKTTTNEIDKRQRDLVRFVGTKICIQIANELSDSTPLVVNFAVVHPRDQNTVNNDKFFRSFGNERSQDFGITLSANDLHCLPINTDRYTVLTHKRIKLGGYNVTTANRFKTQNYDTFKEMSLWVPINRQLRYPATGSQPEQGNVFLVWWCDQFLQPAGSSTVADVMAYDIKAYKYFKETFN